EPRLRAQLPRRVGGNDAGLGHRVGGRELDLQPGLVPALVGPDAAHVGVGIVGNHRLRSNLHWLTPHGPRTTRRRDASGRHPRSSSRCESWNPSAWPSTVAPSEPLANSSRATRATSSAVTRSMLAIVSSRLNCRWK